VTSTWFSFQTPSSAHPTLNSSSVFDPFGNQQPVPMQFRQIGYAFTDTSANPIIGNLGIALNSTTTLQFGATGGGLSSFQFPNGSNINTAQLDIGTATSIGYPDQLTGIVGYSDPQTGMMWGRWSGTSNISTLTSPPTVAAQTSNLHWFATPSQTQAVMLPVTGTWSYTYAGGTSPTDNVGTLGTLNYATFNANFTAQSVDVNVNVTMQPSSVNPISTIQPVYMNALATGVPILPGGNFNTVTPTVTCTGACGTPLTGQINGQFSAPNGAGVGVGYSFNNGATQTVNGVAVFHK
jgi:hypothetical protein